MEDFNFEEDLEQPGRRRSPGCLWNALTILFLLGIVLVVGVFLIVYTNPYVSFNPFPPPTPIIFPTATATPLIVMPPTWTPEPTATPRPSDTPLPTSTPRPTETPLPTLTPFGFIPPPPATATRPLGGYPYAIQRGSPVAIANIYHPEQGCEWMGVGGQAIDLSGSPVTGLLIKLGGELNGQFIDQTSLTGVAIAYGRAGYEFELANQPATSNDQLWVQVLDLDGVPLSDKVFFDTFDDCAKNLIIINFKKVR